MLKVKQITCELGNTHFQWDFSVPESSFLAITGGSGIGKSTLLNVLLGFQSSTGGELYWQQQSLVNLDVHERPFGVLFQKDNLFEHLSVGKNLALGLSSSGRLSPEQNITLHVAAERFDIVELLTKKAHQLSGGQQQRVALARVFLQNKPVLLLDEPFSSLDPKLRQEGLLWLKELQREVGTTILMVTHHLPEIINQVDLVLEGVSSDHWKQYPAG